MLLDGKFEPQMFLVALQGRLHKLERGCNGHGHMLLILLLQQLF